MRFIIFGFNYHIGKTTFFFWGDDSIDLGKFDYFIGAGESKVDMDMIIVNNGMMIIIINEKSLDKSGEVDSQT